MAKKKCTNVKMNLLDKIAGWLLVIGGFNWLPAGISLLFGGEGNDLVRFIFGSNFFSGIIFLIVGISSIYFTYRAFTRFE